MKTKYKFAFLVLVACLCSIYIYYFCEKAKPVKKVDSLINVQRNIEVNDLSNSNYTFDNPKVILNPYKISPLTALIIFETKDLTTPTIEVKGKDSKTTITNTFKPGKVHYLPIYGLYPDSDNTVTLSVNGNTKVIHIKTAALPKDFSKPRSITANKNQLNSDMYFITPAIGGYTAAYDVNGDVRWYLTDKFVWDVQRLNNGHLILSTNRIINAPYYMTGLAEMDLLGKIYYEYNLPGGYHHDVFEMANGDLLVASNNLKGNTVEDYISEVDRETGKVIRNIDLSKIIPSNEGIDKNLSSKYDWFHNNSLWYDSKTNSITVSGRNNDAVINIDYTTNDINWIIGDNTNWSKNMKKYFFSPTDKNFDWQYAQHAAMILPNGNVFMFDNGNNRSKNTKNKVNADDNYSRAVIFNINTDKMTIENVWEYGKELGKQFYSPYISDVDYLGDNHYIVSSGGHSEYKGKVNNEPATTVKYDTLTSTTVELLNDKEIFKMILPTNTYRVEKLSLYSNDVYTLDKGVNLGTLGKTKTIKSNSIVLFNKDGKDITSKYNLKFIKESDRLAVSGSFSKDDKVYLILDNVFDKKTYAMPVTVKPDAAICINLCNKEVDNKKIDITKYVNDVNLSGKYYIYMKINGEIYDFDSYVDYK
jgi:hypothetical protein